MIGQRSVSLSSRPKIHPYGCYFMCLAWLGWKLGDPKDHISPELLIAGYDAAVEKGWMMEDCYVLNPGGIANHFGADVSYEGYSSYADGVPEGRRAIELWQYTGPKSGGKLWKHFVIGNYDPWVRSITRAEGELASFRVFLER